MNLQALVEGTQNTLRTIIATANGYLKVIAVDANGDAVSVGGDASAANQVTGNTALSNILTKLIAAPATEAKQDTLLSRFSPMTFDAGGRLRVSELTTLFDGKTLGADNANLWHGAGTGTFSWSNNQQNLSVTSGQWYVRQGNVFNSYFSGKSQLIECTFRNFQAQANVVKRAGYFSSSATSPHTATHDGFFIENDGTSIYLVVMNAGTQVLKLVSNAWDNAAAIAGYDWSKFTVIAFDFLWLGGTDLRLFIQSPTEGFVLLHTYQHAGVGSDTFIKSPNQPVRYEIRSSTGSGSVNPICAQVSTEGSNKESGESLGLFNATAITTNTVGTLYALKSLKKQVAYRDVAVKISTFGIVNSATSDSGILMLIKDPTLSGAITYTNNGRIQEGTPTNQTVTAGTGTVISTLPVSSEGHHEDLVENSLVWLQNKMDDTLSEYVLVYMPTTATQTVTSILNLKTFG